MNVNQLLDDSFKYYFSKIIGSDGTIDRHLHNTLPEAYEYLQSLKKEDNFRHSVGTIEPYTMLVALRDLDETLDRLFPEGD